MGITGELVRSVFSRSQSFGTQENNGRSNMGEKRRWSSVRSYLCGNEFNSVLAEEDSASGKSSEATVTQPVAADLADNGDVQNQEDIPNEKPNPASSLFREEDAAIILQTAFRRFLARRRNEGIRQEIVVATGSPSRESVDTSIEVQTGNSAEVLSIQEESSIGFQQRMQQKARTQVLRLKEDWDDSTVSSNISKMRIQNRLEATTRRERALAYAFSQQLRICSKRKHGRPDGGGEPNMGWSWLERWMATRFPDSTSVENSTNKQLELINSHRRFMVGRSFFDVAGEEKESCGSNEVPVQFDSFSVTAPKEKDSFKPTKNRLKTSVSRRKTVPSFHCSKEYDKVSRKNCSRETEKDNKHKQKQLRSQKEIKCKDASS